MLKIEQLYKSYGKYMALNGLDMEVKQGELYGFAGPNGAGKTTTIRIISGLLPADSGKVLVDGMEVGKNMTELKNMIGFVPDFFGIYDNLLVLEYLEFFASSYGILRKEARRRSMEVLEMVGLKGQEDQMVDALSRGMKQRLCLARALIHKPRLLVLDEPGSGLDPRTRKDFQELLISLSMDGYTILISSHILSELAAICTNIGIIDKGKMILQGQIDEIMMTIDSENPLVIKVYSNLEKAVEILRKNAMVTRVSIDGNMIVAYFNGSREEEACLLQELIREGVMITSFAREHNSLESLFFHLTDSEREGEKQ